MNKLADAGIDVERWLAMVDADPSAMQRLVAAWPGGSSTSVLQLPKKPGIVYNANAVSRILGLPVDCNLPVPKAADGEIVIYYGSWTLREIRLCGGGKKRMKQTHCSPDREWYEDCNELLQSQPGYYRILLPVPGSDNKSWKDQLRYLSVFDGTAQSAPTVVAVTALLVHLLLSFEDLLDDGLCRCKEAPRLVGSYGRIAITARGGRVEVHMYEEDTSQEKLWLSAIRKV